MPHDSMLWLLQANDSSYPSGAYAHSMGLEELVAAGVVKSPADLENFLMRQILPALLAVDIPFFKLAHAAAVNSDEHSLLEIDAELDAWRLPAELRDASRRIGSRRLEMLCQFEPSAFLMAYQSGNPRSHHLVVTALELSGVPMENAVRAFAYQILSGLVAASMKLMRIGQTACQKILRRTLDGLGDRLDTPDPSHPCGWFNPLLEIASLRHARAHSRLFIS